MKSIRKISTLLSMGLAFLLMAALFFLMAAPHLLQLDPIKQNILSRLTDLTGGQIQYQSIRIDYLPRPEVVFRKAALNWPHRFEISLEELRAFPAVLPLLTGQIELSEIVLQQPQIRLRLPKRQSTGPAAAARWPSVEVLHQQVIALASHPLFQKTGLRYRMFDGSLTLIHAVDDSRLRFNKIQAQIQRNDERLALQLQCTSNLWTHLQVNGQIETSGELAAVHLTLKQFQPHQAPAFFLPATLPPVVDSRFDGSARLQLSPRVLQADLHCRRHQLIFRTGAGLAVFRGPGFRGTVTAQPHTTILTVHRMQFEEPSLEVSGTLFQDRRLPEIRLDLSGTGVQVAPLRERLLDVAGHHRSVRHLFRVLTGGHVPLVTIHVRGKSFAELVRIENFTVRGSLVKGRLHIPGIDLDLEAVKGEAAIDKGLLKARELQAQMAQSIGYDGELTLGLQGRNAPFHLNIETLADMQQLVPVLMRVVRNPTFQSELRRVARITGKARGRLAIGDRLSSLAVDARVSFADLQAVYAPLPHPVAITGGAYHLSRNGLSFSNLQAVVGEAQFHNISGDIHWAPTKRIRIAAEEAEVGIADFWRWLNGFPHPYPELNDIEVSSGRARLSNIYIDGPAEDNGNWRYELSVALTDTHLQPMQQSEAIWISQGWFTVRNPGKGTTGITVKPSRIRWADSWMEVAGVGDLDRGSLTLDLELTADVLSFSSLKAVFGRRPAMAATGRKRILRGTLNVHCDVFQMGDLRFAPVHADIRLDEGGTMVEVTRADVCGVSVPGTVRFTSGKVDVNLKPASNGQTLEPVITCLSQKDEFVSGAYEFSGRLYATAKTADILPQLQGRMKFTARDGRIYRYNLLAKILALVNVTEILRGRLPDIGEEGFAYETIEARGELQGGVLELNNLIVRGASMTIVFGGDIDIVNETLNLKGFVAPLKTFDDIIRSLPILNLIFENRHLVAVPFSIRGNWSDYFVIPLSTSSSTLDFEGGSIEGTKTNPQSVDPHEK